LITRDGLDLAGRQVLVAGGGLDCWLSALLLHAGGARVTLALGETGWQAEASAAVDLGWTIHSGLELASLRRRGTERLTAVLVPGPGRGDTTGTYSEVACDLVVVARRGKPVYDLVYQLGGELALRPELGGFVPAVVARGRTEDRLPGGAGLAVRGEAAGHPPGGGAGWEVA
jgi:hypothetical protein